MRSGEVRRILIECRATIGTVGNEENSLRDTRQGRCHPFGAAYRPTVRGKVIERGRAPAWWW